MIINDLEELLANFPADAPIYVEIKGELYTIDSIEEQETYLTIKVKL